MNCKFLKLLVLFALYNISMCALAQTDDTVNKDTLAFESIATLDSTKLNYDEATWLSVIESRVPAKFKDVNIAAFKLGRKFVEECSA